jgi:hypothetical protein
MAATLLSTFLDISDGWTCAFAQRRTHQRAVQQAVAGLCCGERRTISSLIQTQGAGQRDWSAEYRLHSRSPWKPEELFAPVLQQGHRLCGRKYVPVAFDDTKVKKSGRRVPGASLWVDPLGPKFKVQFLWGLRFLQASMLVPDYRRGGPAARGLPVAFTEVPAVKRPRRSASDEEKAAYKEAVRRYNLSTAFVSQLALLRAQLDAAGAPSKTLIATVDGSFCNRNCMRADVERTVILARARKDAKLCAPSKEPRRTYDTVKFTPHSVRQNGEIAWKQAKVFHGKRYRTIRYKEVGPLLWQGGTGPRPLRLIVLAPTRYRPRGRARKRFYYREAGYLLCTDLSIPASVLIQHYFDRWQIEVNHKEEKDTLGVGEAQLRSVQSVPRQPALVVASYSALMLASIKTHGPKRTDAYCPLPKWYKGAARPTARDLIRLLRQEIVATNAQSDTAKGSQAFLQAAINAARNNKNVQT